MKLNTKKYKEIKDFVYNYPTRHIEGFVIEEQRDIINKIEEKYGKINIDKYWNVQSGITCMRIDDNFVIYHTDVLQSIICGIEDRDQTVEECD